MNAVALYKTTVVKKIVVVVTGFILCGFVFVHWVGNLKLCGYRLAHRTFGCRAVANGGTLVIIAGNISFPHGA